MGSDPTQSQLLTTSLLVASLELLIFVGSLLVAFIMLTRRWRERAFRAHEAATLIQEQAAREYSQRIAEERQRIEKELLERTPELADAVRQMEHVFESEIKRYQDAVQTEFDKVLEAKLKAERKRSIWPSVGLGLATNFVVGVIFFILGVVVSQPH